MSVSDKEKIIRALFAAYLSNDRDAVENFLSRRLPLHQPL